jgi:hypothetical protein
MSGYELQLGAFFSLPRELRDEVYQYLFCTQDQIQVKYRILDDLGWGTPQAAVPLPVALFRTCRPAFSEAHDFLYRNNVFELQLHSSESLQFLQALSPYSRACIKHVILQLSAASFPLCKFISDSMLLQTLTSPDWGNPHFMKNLHTCFLSGSIRELRLKTDEKDRIRHEDAERQEIGDIIASTIEDVVKASVLKSMGFRITLPASRIWESKAWDSLLPYTVRLEEPKQWESDRGRIVVFRRHTWVAHEVYRSPE